MEKLLALQGFCSHCRDSVFKAGGSLHALCSTLYGLQCRRIRKPPLQISELTSSIVPHFEMKIAPLRTQWRDDQRCGPMYPLKDGNLFRGIVNWLSAAQSVVSTRTKTVLLTTVSVFFFLYFNFEKK